MFRKARKFDHLATDEAWEQYGQEERELRERSSYKRTDRIFIIGCWAVGVLGLSTAIYEWLAQ